VEVLSPDTDVVHAVIVIQLFGGAYAADVNNAGQIGLLTFLVTRDGVSERIQLGTVGDNPWGTEDDFATFFFGLHGNASQILTVPDPPAQAGPTLRVPL
jgi:hypothetical protein